VKRRQLISTREAIPAKGQHHKPCTDCPWARTALPGWLGGSTAEEWVQCAHADGTIACHVHEGAQCAGAAIYRANMVKLPRDPDALRLPANRALVFATPDEFRNHHKED
jgi:hypothetical protein